MRVLISGGGTGGHVFPAIAIADAIRKARPDAEILFVGAKGKLEMEKVPKAGYKIEGLWISGLQRKLTLRNALVPFKLAASLFKAWRIVRTFRPDVAVGVGGYASGPTLEMATRLGVPSLIQEQNSFAGVTNRLLGSKVKRICVAYEGMERYFPQEKVVLTGNPVRDAIRNSHSTREEGIGFFQLDPLKKTILVFGGSLGARTLNEAMAAQTKLLAENPGIQVIWQSGSLYIERFRESDTAKLPNVRIMPFIDRMDLAYAAADLIVGRAGALTISELCLVGKPVVLIPSPNVAEDHQTKNAMALVQKDAAVMVKDNEAGEWIIRKPLDILNDPAWAESLGKNILLMARPNAAEDIANEVIHLTTQQPNNPKK
jgi:UDP-N-acetylglucosamine--N-acetylmuramyl-(pentapeptide) pyrophosphoryl-undecaprenol N-acetylglucosamine transferase